MRCPKCGHEMLAVEGTDWQLYEIRTIDWMCPNCLHVERVTTMLIEVKREDR